MISEIPIAGHVHALLSDLIAGTGSPANEATEKAAPWGDE
jgi:hypothetical protein